MENFGSIFWIMTPRYSPRVVLSNNSSTPKRRGMIFISNA
jgi:hypothetical protein